MTEPSSTPKQAWWLRLHRILTTQRLSYAWVAGIGLWAAWLLSAILGPGNFDLADQVVGTDYIQFYAAGVSLRQGEGAHLYDFEFQSQLEQSIAGPALVSFHAFITPPFLGWLFVPLSLLPYLWSFLLWSLFSLALLPLSLRLLASPRPLRGSLRALTWFPVFAAITFGQNSLLSLAILCLVYALWRRSRPLLAGLALSLILFKPQLALGVLFLWLLEWRIEWKSLLGFGLGGGILAALTFLFLPEASQAYVTFSQEVLPGLINLEQFPLWHSHALRSFWLLLFPGQQTLAEILALILSAVGALAFLRIWKRRRGEGPVLFAAAICLTIWITPHAMIYDWAILLIPAALLWQHIPGSRQLWKVLFAITWLVTFLSGPLAYAQKSLPAALQISVPVFGLVLFSLYQKLSEQE